jgi:predicted dehydrogenase
VVALCDVFKPNLDKAQSYVASKGGGNPDGVTDYRRILERKDVDVVFVATPDHWHSPITVAACEAGKDVYVEKPIANNIEDGQKILAAVAKTQRIVQVGLHQRSMKVFADAAEIVKSGQLGRIRHGQIAWPSEMGNRGGARPTQLMGQNAAQTAAPVPDGLDWEMFQGPAPRKAYVPARQRAWRSYWDYGSGAITDLCVHFLDVMHWFTGVDQPRLAMGSGLHSAGRNPVEQVPDIVDRVWKYDAFLMSYSSRPEEWGLYLHCDQGVLQVNRQVLRVKPANNAPGVTAVDFKAPGDTVEAGVGLHVRNFLDAVRSRQQPNCNAETGFKSTVPGLMAAMSVRTGKTYTWDGQSAKAI